MPKIIFVNRYFHPDLSATSQMVTDMARGLAALGAEVHVITGSQGYDDPAIRYAPSEEMDGVHVRRVRTSRFGRMRLWGRAVDYATFYVKAAWRLLRMAHRGDIIVAKTDPPLISVVAAGVSKLRGAVLVNWIQDLFPEIAISLGVMKSRKAAASLRSLRNLSLKAAQWNVVIGHRMAERLKNEGIRGSTIRVIPNWSDGTAITPVERNRNPLIKRWDLLGKFVIGYSGNMGRAHEFRTFLDAAGLLSRQPEIIFLLIGNGAQRSWIVQEVDTRGLKNVMFRPYQPKHQLVLSLGVPHLHLISLYPHLEGLMVPSKFYGVAAAGRPSLYIGGDDGEIPRLLREEACGWTIAPGRSGELADTVARLASHPDQVERAGKNARQAFERRFDRRFAVAAWNDLVGPYLSRD
jgi:glycosyltransferase involved in cell wall biosynthesis